MTMYFSLFFHSHHTGGQLFILVGVICFIILIVVVFLELSGSGKREEREKRESWFSFAFFNPSGSHYHSNEKHPSLAKRKALFSQPHFSLSLSLSPSLSPSSTCRPVQHLEQRRQFTVEKLVVW
jgi:hypothetical protein